MPVGRPSAFPSFYLSELPRALSGGQSRSRTGEQRRRNTVPGLRRTAPCPRWQIRPEIFSVAEGRPPTAVAKASARTSQCGSRRANLIPRATVEEHRGGQRRLFHRPRQERPGARIRLLRALTSRASEDYRREASNAFLSASNFLPYAVMRSCNLIDVSSSAEVSINIIEEKRYSLKAW
jgi:hypothetical protein